jgi:hypothetical protein
MHEAFTPPADVKDPPAMRLPSCTKSEVTDVYGSFQT